jgi:hypothetical protein
MTEVAVEVPEGVASAVRETVVLLYRATAEALHLSLAAGEQAGEALEEVQGHRERLRALDRLLDQVEWPQGSSRTLVLTAPRELLRDALHGALIDAGERLAVACEASWRDEASAASVREAARDVIELDRLLRELDAGDAG